MNDISIEDDRKTVLVTGFGPFSNNVVNVPVNASGKAVELINKDDIESRLNITLFTEEVPVEYKFVDKNIPMMWKELKPDLTIHVGISGAVESFTFEKQAQKAAYSIEDGAGDSPADKVNPCNGPDTVATDLQVELICKKFNDSLPEEACKADVSDDAGKFLCEYIYYTSLCQQQNAKTTLFVHVPEWYLDDEHKELAVGLERILEICLDDIRRKL